MEFYILSCEKALGLRPQTFFTAKNEEILGLYLIWSLTVHIALKIQHYICQRFVMIAAILKYESLSNPKGLLVHVASYKL